MKTIAAFILALSVFTSAVIAQQVTDSSVIPQAPITIQLPPIVVPPAAVSPFVWPVWTNVPYSASNFSGGANGSWTVPQASVNKNRYVLLGKTMIWSLAVNPTSVSGGSPYLAVRIPAGKISNGTADTCTYQLIEGAGSVGVAFTFGANGWLFLYHADTTLPWQALSNTGVNFTCTLEVQ